MSAEPAALLEVRDLHVQYGAIRALHGISFDVRPGEIVAVIGTNGAGKSTCLNAIAGVVRPAAGHIRFDGREIGGQPAHRIHAAGIAYSPEGRRLFAPLSVEENLLMGAFLRRDRAGVADSLSRVYELFPRLRERRRQLAATLSGGEQQMLATGRSLMSRPRLLLMDEPSTGLAPLLVRQLFEVMARINREEGTAILLVEQNVRLALGLAHHAHVLETGSIVISGPARELRRSDLVRRSYLGIA